MSMNDGTWVNYAISDEMSNGGYTWWTLPDIELLRIYESHLGDDDYNQDALEELIMNVQERIIKGIHS